LVPMRRVRGYPVEAFTFPGDGLPGLLRAEAARFSLDADLQIAGERLQYRVGVEIHPAAGSLLVWDEYLTRLGRRQRPAIEVVGDRLLLRPQRKGHPPEQQVGLNYTLLSDRRLSGTDYDALDKCRDELGDWRTYYLDPRIAMRSAQPPAEVRDIGVPGHLIAPYLHRLKVEHPKRFGAVRRTLRSLVPSVEDLDVELDERRGELDIRVRQDGCDFSSRIISEGTLRVLALCAIAVNPWAKGVVAFEEPENGVHPRRLELIAELLVSLATQGARQVIVTTHSGLFCATVLRLTEANPDRVAVLSVQQREGGTQVRPVEFPRSLFQEQELLRELSSPTQDGIFEALLLRGLLDE